MEIFKWLKHAITSFAWGAGVYAAGLGVYAAGLGVYAAGLGAYAAWIRSLCSNCENNTISA